MAGKAFAFDHFKVSQMVATGAYSWDETAAMTRAQNISFEAVDPRARMDSLFRRCPTLNETWYHSLTGRAAVWRQKGHERGFTLECPSLAGKVRYPQNADSAPKQPMSRKPRCWPMSVTA
jgi:hypothetical protein